MIYWYKMIKETIILKRESTHERLIREGKEKRRKTFKSKTKRNVREKRSYLQKAMDREPVKYRRLKTKTTSKYDPPKTVMIVDDRGKESLLAVDRDTNVPAVKHRKRRRTLKMFTMKDLYKALRKVQTEKDKMDLMEHFVRTAYHDNNILKALMGKILPDLKSIDAKIVQKSPYKLILDVRPLAPQLESNRRSIESTVMDNILDAAAEDDE